MPLHQSAHDDEAESHDVGPPGSFFRIGHGESPSRRCGERPHEAISFQALSRKGRRFGKGKRNGAGGGVDVQLRDGSIDSVRKDGSKVQSRDALFDVI